MSSCPYLPPCLSGLLLIWAVLLADKTKRYKGSVKTTFKATSRPGNYTDTSRWECNPELLPIGLTFENKLLQSGTLKFSRFAGCFRRALICF